jgi:hypothetical protein
VQAGRASPGGRRLTIVSGGQTGVDQAALRAAQDTALSCGGWCPPGRECEGGVIPARFPMRETERERSTRAPTVPRSLRTERNVRDADATLILRPVVGPGSTADAGTEWAARCAEVLGRPLLVCDPADPSACEAISGWIDESGIGTLHVAGPSEGVRPGIGEAAYALLVEVLSGRPE